MTYTHRRALANIPPQMKSSYLLALLFLVFIIAFSCEIYYTIVFSFEVDQKWKVKRPRLDEIFNYSTKTTFLPSTCHQKENNSSTVISLSSLFDTNYTTDKFTIVIPTYKRNYCLYSSLRHYCKIRSVANIIVLWNNIGDELPNYLKLLKCKAGVKYMKMDQNRMTSRYRLFPEIQTEGMILALHACSNSKTFI